MNSCMAAEPEKRQRGVLIAFEGIDGTGKSTQLRLLAEELQRRGYKVVQTREPTDGPFGRRLRELFADRQSMSREAELELFMADRRQHVEEVIGPALRDGRVVLTDRYYFSTAAYQGAAGFDPDEIIRMNEQFAPVPDLVLLLVASPATGVDRIRCGRGEALNDFEQEEGLQRVAAVFDRLRAACIERVDASLSIDAVQRTVLELVNRRLAMVAPEGGGCGPASDQELIYG
ncbi:MAG: dTMP kinase [Deltaproteobacteria bacterium RIFOXYD12_FULL_57_12]|nr:MAG: dTMP kinase [Deltaproteobacteria bacterium RIFOXYD12_FULL_57_12]